MANVLPSTRRLEVLAALVNGTSIRAASRMTGVHQDTIGRFGFAVGVGCERLHDRIARDIGAPLVDMDEQHSWCGKREVNVDPVLDDVATVGEQWTWASICRTSKLIVAWTVGKRDAACADALVADTRARLSVMPQITTDGCPLYIEPIGRHFGYGVDYAQTVKHLSHGGGKPGFAEKFSHAKGVDFIEKRAIFGAPDLSKATTYAIERSNLTNRVWNARLIRRTLCFSKRVDRHGAAVALGYVYRNLCHIPRNMRQTAAMAAGITDHVWGLDELMLAALAEPAGEKPTAQPLTYRQPVTTARELPGGGFLRVVGGAPGAAPTSPATPPAPPVAPLPAVAASSPQTAPAAPDADHRQLDLLAWRPRAIPPAGTQMDLF